MRPDYAVLLTGHALGALLAAVVGAKLKLDSVTLALPRADLALLLRVRRGAQRAALRPAEA